MNNRRGFMLLEAVLAVVIVSICLTFITQSLLTNFRTGMRFQETIRSFIVMENTLGLLYASQASEEQFNAYPQSLEKPYDKFTLTSQIGAIDDHLKSVAVKLNWPMGHSLGQLDLTTVIYNPDAIQK